MTIAAFLAGAVNARTSHEMHLRSLKTEAFAPLVGVYLSSYEVKEAYPADVLAPSAVDKLPGVAVAAVYDEAVSRRMFPAGIVSAHNRRGKFVTPTPDNVGRVYAGPSKPPYADRTVFGPM